jgi:hypothetical protein
VPLPHAALLGPRFVREHHGASGVVQSGRVAGGDGAVGAESRLEPRQCFDRRVGPVVLVHVELRCSLFAGHFNRNDLRLEMTVGLRGGKPLLRSQCPTVLRLASDLVFLHQIFRLPAGMRVGERIVQSVAQHAIIELAIAHAVAPPTARDEIRRLLHVLHAASHRDIDISKGNLLGRGNNGLCPRAADAIDRKRRRHDGQPGMDSRLPGGIHLGAGLDDVAHDDSFHLVGAKLRARDRSADRHSTESGSWHVLETASKGADRGANRFGENDCTRCHDKASRWYARCVLRLSSKVAFLLHALFHFSRSRLARNLHRRTAQFR